MPPILPKRVLVIDGGCFRGLSCLLSIEEITKKVAQRSGEDYARKPCDIFDLICGSGVGGLIAILLGRFGMDCTTAIEAYTQLIRSICGPSASNFYDSVLQTENFLNSAAFEEALLKVLHDYSSARELMAPQGDAEIGTKTFVTTVHNTSNRVYLVRSYPSPKSALLPPPHTHQWYIDEAIKACLGCPLFVAPLQIEGSFGYSDAGFAGFNNPINQAYSECEKLWGSDQPVTFISLGTSIGSISLDSKGPLKVTDQQASKFLNCFASNIPKSWTPSKLTENKTKFLALVKRFMTIARETRTASFKAEATDPQRSNRKYYRLDPPLRLPEVVFCDLFHEATIRQSIKDWTAGEGQADIANIVATLATLPPATNSREIMEAKIKEAQSWEVPKPLEGTVNPGYNPELDEKRPTTMIEYLKRYYVLLVIDDSHSMKGTLWREARDALKGIADYALEYNTNTVEVMFLNSPKRYKAVKGHADVLFIFDEVSPHKGTPTGKCLQTILDEHIGKLDRALNTPEYATISPLDIIVITDGRPSDNPAEVMAQTVRRMKQAKHHPNCIGVQFVQIGNDLKAKDALEKLVHGDNGSMVDTVPYKGVLTSDRLARILLGGLHPNVRAMILE